jgi:hypothetical protein
MMHIDQDLAKNIEGKLKAVIEDQNIELEAVYSETIEDVKFKNLIKHLKINDNFKPSQINTLDISQNQKGGTTRVTIEGDVGISDFCTSNGKIFPENVKMLRKSQNDKLTHTQLRDLGFRLNMKRETEIDQTSIQKLFELNKDTTFRLKKRYSFQADSFRIDMTVVRQITNKYDLGDFNVSLSRAKPSNEVEIEFIPKDSHCSDKEVCSKLTEDLLNLMYVVSCVFRSVADKPTAVIKGYKKLLDIKENASNKTAEIDQKEFLSYKPVTLQVSNLDERCKGVPGNILKNYAVTEKADGDRMLLFIYQSKIYLLNDQRKVLFTGIESKKLESANNSLIDGEFVKNDKNGNKIKLFLGFDIYFHKGEDVRSLPFMVKESDRYKLLNSVIQEIKEVDTPNSPPLFQFDAKKFVYDDKNVFTATKKVYDRSQYNYKIDGLIFQPTNLGCGDLYINHNANKKTYSLSTTWNRVFKWKPPSQNTIDLMIKIPEGLKDSGATKLMCELRAYKNEKNRSVELRSITQILVNGEKDVPNKKKDVPNKKNYAVFATQTFDLSDLKDVENGDILEFKYDKDKDKQWTDQRNDEQEGQWKIYNKRKDKTKILKLKNEQNKNIDDYNLAGSANAITTANNVYSTIVKQPINEHIITAGEELKLPDVEMTAQYYVNTDNREDRLILPMQNFHNFVKDNLILKFGGGKIKKSLVDVACGVGGDIKKYAKNKRFNLVLGFDISFDGIFGNDDSAWVRYLRDRSKEWPPMLFLPQDMGRPLGEFSENENKPITNVEKDFQMISKYINNKIDYDDLVKHLRVPEDDQRIKNKLQPFKQVLNKDNKFDVVSCQFALHYFFKNEDTLKTFCENVDALLKKEGHFIGTCFNGEQVNESFGQNKKVLEGNILGNVVWRINKQYEDYTSVGSAIDVYVESIGQSRREYLVDIKFLAKILKEYGIELIEQYSFADSFDQKFGNDTKIKMVDGQKDALKRYSEMNQCFIFKKK